MMALWMIRFSLDEFFRRYASEDNDSFSKILEKVNKKTKEKYGYLTAEEKEEDVKSIEDVKKERITDGYGTSDQPPSTLEGWKYTAKNLLMYHPADHCNAPLTEQERAVRIAGLTKEINRRGFMGRSWIQSPRRMIHLRCFTPQLLGQLQFLLTGKDIG